MSFDKPTRNKLAAMVGECKRLLTEDIRDQLQVMYGLQPDGTALPIERLGRLDDSGREVAQQLREWQEHVASTEIGTESQTKKAAFERVAHETAFTVLNRLAALRMCEERGHVIECVRRGMESDGFALYERLSGGVFGTRGETYRIFLEHMFDELAVDLGVLFDRRAPQSLVFPRDRCLEDVLLLLNSQELTLLWKEDETIGWIYQHFNSKEEREEMRKKSPAPRNSRELAVRNQFFTPRYVVEFVVDNTLGRLWYEMRKGDTALKDACRYLVRRPTEVFLRDGEQSPVTPNGPQNLNQEELLKQPVYILHRSKKDPRDLRILDPACGSGHFLLYAFDLLETIYEESWADEHAVKSRATGKTLRENYPELDRLKRALPELILRHNLHGIDIDLRACQIAALALWLRAQRTYQRFGLKPSERPQVKKSNVVCAEPMPGESQLLDEFVANARPKVLGQLVQVVFEKMKLAGEAGSLLKIEEEIAGTVADAKKKWLAGPKAEQTVLFGDLRPQQTEFSFDFSGIDDETFWEKAEERTYAELQKYAERAENGHGYQRRLFANDTARGFAFVDVCRNFYDIVLMNPPFGEPSKRSKEYIETTTAAAKADIYTAFLFRWCQSLHENGKLGAITPRSFIYQVDFHEFRKLALFPQFGLPLLVELGFGELDEASNRTATFVLTPSRSRDEISLYTSVAESLDKARDLLRAASNALGSMWQPARIEEFDLPESSQLLFRLSSSFRALLATIPRLDPVLGKSHKGARNGVVYIVNGLQCPSDFRYVRLWTEVHPGEIGSRWFSFLKPIHFAPYVSELACVVNWHAQGAEQKTEYEESGISPSKYVSGETFYPSSGVWFPDVSERGIGAALIPFPAVPGRKGLLAVGKEHSDVPSDALAGFLNSVVAEGVLGITTPERHHKPSYMGQIPWINVPRCIEASAKHYWRMTGLASTEAGSELSPEFSAPNLVLYRAGTLNRSIENVLGACRAAISKMEAEQQEFDNLLLCHLNADVHDSSLLGEMSNRAKVSEWFPTSFTLTEDARSELVNDLLGYIVGSAFGRWNLIVGLATQAPVARIRPRSHSLKCTPAILQNERGLPLAEDDVRRLQAASQWDYPLEIPWDGILVDDPGPDGTQPHRDDIVRRVEAVLNLIWKDGAEKAEEEACEILRVKELREYFRKPALFFDDHLKRYSKSRRQAPIYWPLSTASGLYTLCIYYQRLNDDLLYTALNKYVKPKIDDTERALRRIESGLSNAAGRAASDLRRTFERTVGLLDELREFRDELARVAALPYKPNLNDGVLITASPLWKLFQLPGWRRDLEECWNKLEAGEYDWSYLAYSIWPDRVREVSRHDRSIAIAHGLEELCEVTPKPAKKKRSKKEEIEETVLGDEG
jgi:hypothetical protein